MVLAAAGLLRAPPVVPAAILSLPLLLRSQRVQKRHVVCAHGHTVLQPAPPPSDPSRSSWGPAEEGWIFWRPVGDQMWSRSTAISLLRRLKSTCFNQLCLPAQLEFEFWGETGVVNRTGTEGKGGAAEAGCSGNTAGGHHERKTACGNCGAAPAMEERFREEMSGRKFRPPRVCSLLLSLRRAAQQNNAPNPRSQH